MKIPTTTRQHRSRAKLIIPVITLACILVGLMNVFLMANIIMLENLGGQGAAVNTPQGTNKSLLEYYNLKNFQPTEGNNSMNEDPSRLRSMEKYRAAKAKPLSGSSWESFHRVNCREVVRDLEKEGETGMYLPIRCPSAACSDSLFLMNVHDPMSDSVSYAIYKEGCFECDHIARLLDALSRYPDSSLLDVGGNIGMWSLAAAAAGHMTFTIEPYAPNYQRICKSVSKNSFHDRINVVSIAATAENTTFRINIPNKNKGGGRVEPMSSADNVDQEYIVKGVPIDSLNLPTDRPMVVKIDVEGHELQALAGALGFLRSVDVVYAMTELRPTFQRDEESYRTWKEILGVLSSKGLAPFRMDYGNETRLNVGRLHEWKHIKHPSVRYFDVVWRKDY